MPRPAPTPTSTRERLGFVRVAAVSPELVLGDVGKNVAIIAREARTLAQRGCRLAVFPELSLTGYSCADLFHTSVLLDAALKGLGDLIQATQDLPCVLVVGLPLRVQDRLYNVAAVLAKGRILGLVPKTFLPNSAEFYERRWFSPAHTLTATSLRLHDQEVALGNLLFEALDVPGFVLGVEICEDLWTVIPPSSHLALAGAVLLANPSASTEVLGKAPYRRHLVAQQSARCLAAYLYAGAGAGESTTDVVYSGHGLVAENGSLLGETERFSFETRAIITDVDVQHLAHDRLKSTAFRDEAGSIGFRRVAFSLGAALGEADTLLRPVTAHPFVPSAKADRAAVCEEIFAIQATGLARRLKQARAKTAVLGLSGGLDSTLALLVVLEALRRAGMPSSAVLTITMPGFGTTTRTKGNAEKLAEALNVELRTISINEAVHQHFADIGHSEHQHDATYENSQARERTQILMDVANKTGGIVIGTGDLSEAALGWCTFNGDHMSMYHVNTGVPKTLVRYLIEWCAAGPFAEKAGEVLRDIADTPITPELLPLAADASLQQKTEDTIGPYELHDFFLFHFVRHGSNAEKIRWLAAQAFAGVYDDATISKWLALFFRRFAQNQFKRSVVPDGPKVGSVALSPRGDWRMPSDYAGELG
ncbi:NAD(+) synthase [Prosthecobacter vanneervenii]|uniref:Glutamine-dependent NAD(+) synthetase n=1 Tax=Prosthecobacter vanneervenii TaxID=48466 RepID=A0A7W8DKI6_9BACT|nr:NAD(+) synthase [Prosthecobacter vanneervenii]MBB5033080.1 NAD+ synthase (glutamine-hydrolyzing) [Prosthecobacter vanneervenii]